jgi:hypothetical protein
MVTRLRRCDERITAGRLRKAEQFLDAAETLQDFADKEAEVGDAFVTLCILAGIAASDTICCRELGQFAQGDDHNQAISQLAKAGPEGKRLSNDLRALLQMKNRAEYESRPVNAEQRKRAWRRSENLVEAARSR